MLESQFKVSALIVLLSARLISSVIELLFSSWIMISVFTVNKLPPGDLIQNIVGGRKLSSSSMRFFFSLKIFH